MLREWAFLHTRLVLKPLVVDLSGCYKRSEISLCTSAFSERDLDIHQNGEASLSKLSIAPPLQSSLHTLCTSAAPPFVAMRAARPPMFLRVHTRLFFLPWLSLKPCATA